MPAFLHTRVRVSDLDTSIAYYCDHLGFKVKSRSDRSPAGNRMLCQYSMSALLHW